MLAVYVHKDNPIKSLTLQQVDAIFSKTRKGARPQLRTWRPRLTAMGQQAHQLYGTQRESAPTATSRTTRCQGDYKDEVKEIAGSSAVVKRALAGTSTPFGYSGIGTRPPTLRRGAARGRRKSAPVEAVAEHAYSGELPARPLPLHRYVNKKPGAEHDPRAASSCATC
jgi:phosphate transport system substrate-binding protein